MANPELAVMAERLREAGSPEQIFGPLAGPPIERLRQAKILCRRLEKLTHPDCYSAAEDKIVATEAFKRLIELWETAQVRIAAGTYGNIDPPRMASVRVRTRKGDYFVEGLLAQGDLCNLYACTYDLDGKRNRGIFKVARAADDSDLVRNEARVLRRLISSEGYGKFRPYVPELIDSLSYREDDSSVLRQANVFSGGSAGLVSLKEVREYYHRGVDPRDMAWIWRRLLMVLGFAHRSGVVHGAVLPPHVLLYPEGHGLVLVDWCYAVCDPETLGERIRAISLDYAGWYPPEVLAKQNPRFGTDIYLGARCMVYLLGGNPVTGELLETVPKPLRAFFKGCSLTSPAARPQDAWRLLEEFDELLERLWGPRRFRPFYLPNRHTR